MSLANRRPDSAVSDTLALIVDLIGDNPDGIAKLLATHVDDGSGHCRACPLAGQRGFDSWPCIHHTAATLAAERLPLTATNRMTLGVLRPSQIVGARPYGAARAGSS
jgi:hypothetical protein